MNKKRTFNNDKKESNFFESPHISTGLYPSENGKYIVQRTTITRLYKPKDIKLLLEIANMNEKSDKRLKS